MKFCNFLLTTAIGIVIASGSARAEYVYTYTGNNFDGFASDLPINPFSSSDYVTFSFTTNDFVKDGFINLKSITDWSISDGIDSFSINNAYPLANFGPGLYFKTDDSGMVTNWFFSAVSLSYPSVAISLNSSVEMSSIGHLEKFAGEVAQVNPTPTSGYYFALSDVPGTWNLTVSGVPLPAALPMFGAAIAALTAFAAKRRRDAGV